VLYLYEPGQIHPVSEEDVDKYHGMGDLSKVCPELYLDELGRIHLVFKEDIHNYLCIGNQSEVMFLVPTPLALNLCPSQLFFDVTNWI